MELLSDRYVVWVFFFFFFFLDDSSEGLQNAEQRKQFLQPLPDFLTKAFGFKQEDQIMPCIELEKEVNLGDYSYSLVMV